MNYDVPVFALFFYSQNMPSYWCTLVILIPYSIDKQNAEKQIDKQCIELCNCQFCNHMRCIFCQKFIGEYIAAAGCQEDDEKIEEYAQSIVRFIIVLQ